MNILQKAIQALNKINKNKLYRDYAKILNNTKLSDWGGVKPSVKDLRPYDIYMLSKMEEIEKIQETMLHPEWSRETKIIGISQFNSTYYIYINVKSTTNKVNLYIDGHNVGVYDVDKENNKIVVVGEHNTDITDEVGFNLGKIFIDTNHGSIIKFQIQEINNETTNLLSQPFIYGQVRYIKSLGTPNHIKIYSNVPKVLIFSENKVKGVIGWFFLGYADTDTIFTDGVPARSTNSYFYIYKIKHKNKEIYCGGSFYVNDEAAEYSIFNVEDTDSSSPYYGMTLLEFLNQYYDTIVKNC